MRKNGRILLVCLVLALVTLAVFWQVRHFAFVNFDDPVYVTENRNIQSGITREGIFWAFSTAYAEFWHPLTWLSLMLDYELYGLKPGGYHMTNLLLHIAGTLLLFLFLQRTTGALWQSAFVAALFALHPLHVESVVWIAERKDVLSAVFCLLTLYAYACYTEKPVLSRYLLTLICFSLGLMSKPMLVTLPCLLLLLDFWPLKRLYGHGAAVPAPTAVPIAGERKRRKTGSKKKMLKESASPHDVPLPMGAVAGSRTLFRLVREKIPFFILSAVFSAIAFHAQYGAPVQTFPISSRIANALISYVLYIEKSLWPQGLAVFYPFPALFPPWKVAGAAMLLLLASLAVTLAAKRLPYLFVGWFWFLGTLVPVIGIVQVGNQALADRYTYIPLIGLFMMAAWGAPALLKKWRYGKAVLAATAVATLLASATVTYSQAGHWQNSMTLFSHALRVTTDNYIAHNSLGVVLSDAGRAEEAMAHYREAIRIEPDYLTAYLNLGFVLFNKGSIGEAIRHYREAIRIDQKNEIAHNALGEALVVRGSVEEAQARFRTALRIKPDFAEAHYNLGNILASRGLLDEAGAHFQEAVRLSPGWVRAHNNFGSVLLMQGRIDAAIGEFREALRIDPDYAKARDNLNRALQAQVEK